MLFPIDAHDLFSHILQGCLACTGNIIGSVTAKYSWWRWEIFILFIYTFTYISISQNISIPYFHVHCFMNQKCLFLPTTLVISFSIDFLSADTYLQHMQQSINCMHDFLNSSYVEYHWLILKERIFIYHISSYRFTLNNIMFGSLCIQFSLMSALILL